MLSRFPRVAAAPRFSLHGRRPRTLELAGPVSLRLLSAATKDWCCILDSANQVPLRLLSTSIEDRCAKPPTRTSNLCTSNRRRDPSEQTSDSESRGQPFSRSYRNVLDGVGFFELLTISPRHLLSAAALELLRVRRPGIWNGPEFFQGAQQAIRAVFELLADANIEALEDLVDARLLAKLIGDDARAAATVQAWSAPPALQSVRLLGLLGAGGQEEGGQRRVLVTSVFCTCEEYSYASGNTELLRRVQKWTFARQIEGDCSWMLADMGSTNWFWEQDVVE